MPYFVAIPFAVLGNCACCCVADNSSKILCSSHLSPGGLMYAKRDGITVLLFLFVVLLISLLSVNDGLCLL